MRLMVLSSFLFLLLAVPLLADEPSVTPGDTANAVPAPEPATPEPVAPEPSAPEPATPEPPAPEPDRSAFELPDTPPVPFNGIDPSVLTALAAKGIKPAPVCSDAVFIRRVYLDVIGTIPKIDEVQAFLADERPDKRALLIDTVLARPEFIDYWALKWSDTLRIKAEFPINLWPNGAMVYHRWIRESLRTNKPFDLFARELLTSSGSDFRNGPANFYRAVQNRDAHTIAEAVGLTFMGVRTGSWANEQRDQMSVFFSRVRYKKTAEWKEDIVYWDDTPLDSPDIVFPDGTPGRVEPGQDPRVVFTDWLIRPENPWFARNAANRIWFWLFGIGLVQEPDDFRPDNPPSIPPLLDYLADELVKSNYDMRQLYRLILNSRTYQQSSILRSDHPEGALLFAAYPTRPVEAEVVQDMLRQIIGINIDYMSEVPEPFTVIPNWRRTITLADGSITSAFLETFGRPTRDSGVEADRNTRVNVAQRMYFYNSADVANCVEQSGRIRGAAGNAANAARAEAEKQKEPFNYRRFVLDYLWLSFLSRRTTQQEYDAIEVMFQQKRSENDVYADLIWTLINMKEFSCKH